ncbi:MAG: carbamoyltransferase C-terminal domain-containing protein [Acidimicrobiales bacterium]
MTIASTAGVCMRVLGLSFSGHGSSLCLVEDGRIVAATNLERLTRVKFALATLPSYEPLLTNVLRRGFGFENPPPFANFYDVFPQMLESVCGESELAEAGIDLVVKTHDNIRPIRRRMEPYLEFCEYFAGTQTMFDLEHHLCHAYQAYLCSPFDDTAILTIDGRGENLERLDGNALSTTTAVGRDNRVTVLSEVQMPSSVGGMYASATNHLGFREEQEGNTMALAAFGTDRFYRLARESAYTLLDDGGFELGLRPTQDGHNFVDQMVKFCPRREVGGPLTQDHFDLAWGFQQFAEEIIVHVTQALYDRTGSPRLAIAGGVGLNCVANTEILRQTPFRELYVMPNAGDRGLAAGAALYGYHVIGNGTERHPLVHDFLGRTATEGEITQTLGAAEATDYLKSDDIAADCAALIAKGRIIGWVQGGAEFGPRALGHRSILADPRTAASKERLDRDIKRREWFRPYAPSVLAEHADEYFEMFGPSPYMLLAVNTRPEVRDKVPAIVHVDGSARVQTVERDVEPLYHRLISSFHDLTDVPLVLDTSMNGYGEPMVETTEDAVAALHSMGLDALAVGDHLVWKQGSPP